MNIIDKILTSQFFTQQPPVLIDIGASGEINQKWKKIAPYSICIAFDADEREFNVTEQINKTFKKLITVNRIVTASKESEIDFYLTSWPYCSSLLKPETDKLEPWIFSKLFNVEKVTKLPGITLDEALNQAGINYIDWFKTDTQGTDLRLFMSLKEPLRRNVLAAEFEPGIIDAYKGEDKLYKVMETLSQVGFWLSAMVVKGTQRLNADYKKKYGEFNSRHMLRESPCWAELTYLRNPELQNERAYLLLYVFALLETQFGFALEVAEVASKNYSSPLWQECKTTALKKINNEKRKVPLVVLKKQFNKFFSNIHD